MTEIIFITDDFFFEVLIFASLVLVPGLFFESLIQSPFKRPISYNLMENAAQKLLHVCTNELAFCGCLPNAWFVC